jgi:hypothetical protein
MSHKLGICIPYRDRKEHIERLIPHLSKKLNQQGIEHSFYVGHQIDDKLFNRGAMKNIAAHYAFEDGCDYIAWHDVDMLLYDQDGITADYSYPEETPLHIATKLSKYNYGLGYDQYFGGVVLFTKEQAYKTNGYSNDYWDWGQEDDDLFWRCYFEGYTTGNIFKKYDNVSVANFNGDNSFIEIPTNREISSSLHNDHTISILFNAEQQPEKVPIWLVGGSDKRFIEYPILRKDGGWSWGLSFNNSRAVTMNYFDRDNNRYYNWAKRFENQWTWVTVTYSSEKNEIYFYINNDLCLQMDGIKQEKSFKIEKQLKVFDSIKPFLLGFCNHTNTYYKGKIAKVKMFDRFFSDINECLNSVDNLLVDVNFETVKSQNIEITNESIDVIENIIPFRREGSFYCIPHIDEGYVGGNWAKGETTARNEKRFVTEMQQGKIDYKNDGLKNILEMMVIDNIDVSLYPNTSFINVKMK